MDDISESANDHFIHSAIKRALEDDQPVQLSDDAVQVTSDDPTTGQEAELKFTVTLSVLLPEDGQIEIRLPKWITTEEGFDSDESMVTNEILQSCHVQQQDLQSICQIAEEQGGLADQVIVVDGLKQLGPVNSGQILYISLKNVKNPVSLKPRPGIQISTLAVDGRVLNISPQLSLRMSKVFRQESPEGSSVLLRGDTAPGRPGSYVFTFKTTLPIPRGGYLVVLLPNDIRIRSDVSEIEILGANHFAQAVSLHQGDTSHEIKFKDAFSQEPVPAKSTILFTLNYLQNPTHSDDTGSFAFKTFDEAGYGIEALDSGMSVSSRVGRLKNISFAPIAAQQGVYQVSTTFDLKMTLESGFYPGMRIVVEFSDDILSYQPVADAGCTLSSSIIQIADSYLCQVVSSKKTITIEHLVKEPLQNETVLEVKIASMRVRNPASSKKSSSVYIYTANADKVVDVGTSAAFAPTPSRLLLARVAPSSSVTSAQNVKYSITIQPSGPIPKDASIKVVLPAEVEINDFSEIESYCNSYPVAGTILQNDQLPDFSCSVIDSGRAIKINDLFMYGSTAFYQAVSFTIPGLQNPRYVDVPTASFQMYIFESDLMVSQVYAMTEGIFVTMTIPNPFSRINIQSGSIVNKAIATYRLEIEGTVNARAQDQLEVRFPKQTKVQSPVECISHNSQPNESLQCSVDKAENLVRIIVDKPGIVTELSGSRRRELYTGRQKFAVSISKVMNNETTEPSDQFEIRLVSESGHLIAENLNGGSVSTLVPFKLPVSAFYAEPAVLDLGASTDYRVVIKPETYVPGMLLELKLPSQLSLIDIFAIDCAILFSKDDAENILCEYDTIRDSIMFTRPLSAPPFDVTEGLVFKFGKIRNPTSLLETASFGVTSFTADGYLIDQRLDSLRVRFACRKPCRLCAPETNNQCIACFAEDDPFTPDRSVLSNGQCVKHCPFPLKPLISKDTFPDFIHTTCVKCFDVFCDRCSGPLEGQCTKCMPAKVLSEGFCVDPVAPVLGPQPDNYWFPFLVFSLLCIILAIILKLCTKRRKVSCLPMAIPGVALISLIMALYDGIALYPQKGAENAATAMLIFGLVLPFIPQFCFLAFMQLKLVPDVLYQELRRDYKATILLLIAGTFVLDVRVFKLSYCNLSSRFNYRTLRDTDIRQSPRPKRLYMILSFFAIPFDLAMAIIAITVLVWPDADTRLIKVSIERICIAIILITMTILEYYMPKRNCCKSKKSFTIAPQVNVGSAPVYDEIKSTDNAYRALSASVLTDVADHTVNGPFTLQPSSPKNFSLASSRLRKQFDLDSRYLERTESAERYQEKDPELYRFLKKPLTTNLVTKDEQQYLSGLHEDGYFSDPTHLGGIIERRKLKKVAPHLGEEFKATPLPKQTQVSSSSELSDKIERSSERQDTSFNDDMGITPALFDDLNHWKEPDLKDGDLSGLSMSECARDEEEPKQVQRSPAHTHAASSMSSIEQVKDPNDESYKLDRLISDVTMAEMSSLSRPDGVVPPIELPKKKIKHMKKHKERQFRVASQISPLPNRHRPDGNVPIGQLPLCHIVFESNRKQPKHSPQSHRLRSTHQSFMQNATRSDKRGGSVYNHDGLLPPDRPLVNQLAVKRSQSKECSDAVFQKRLTMEQAALAVIKNRFGLRSLSRDQNARPSNILYRASYHPRRFMLQEWYSTEGQQPPSIIKQDIRNESGSSKSNHRESPLGPTSPGYRESHQQPIVLLNFKDQD